MQKQFQLKLNVFQIFTTYILISVITFFFRTKKKDNLNILIMMMTIKKMSKKLINFLLIININGFVSHKAIVVITVVYLILTEYW